MKRYDARRLHVEALEDRCLLTTLFVDVANLPGPGSGTELDPFVRIQDGIDAAQAGDEVQVASGTYAENITMKSGVDVLGEGAQTTRIVGAALTTGVVQISSVTDATLSGFTLTVAAPQQGVDRAIAISGSTNVVIEKNLVLHTQYGVLIFGATAVPTIQGNTFVGDSDEQGISIQSSPGSIVIRNNIVTGYTFAGIFVAPANATPVIQYNDLFDNGTHYRNYPDQTGINGNISVDPLFVGDGDYRLQPGSPVIDAGDPSSPLDADGTRADMGALPVAQATRRVREVPFAITGEYQVPFELFSVNTPGTIEIEVSWTGTSELVTAELQGRRRPGLPDPTAAYAQISGSSPLTLTYDVTPADLARGVGWRAVIRDSSGHGDATGTMTITTPYNAATEAIFQREKIALRSGEHWPSPALQADFLDQLTATSEAGIHGLISLTKACDCFDNWRLERAGLVRQSYLPGWNAIGLVRKGIDLDDPLLAAAVRAITPLEPEDKVEPSILVGNYGHYVVAIDEETQLNWVINGDGSINISLIFAADIPLPRIREILAAHTLNFSPVTDRHWNATLDRDMLVRLVEHDEVEWIEDGPLPFLAANDTTRGFLNVDTVQNFNSMSGVYAGLSGNGVVVGIQDNGIDATHGDLSVVQDNPGGRPHGTHVAGIVAGSGGLSAGTNAAGVANGGTPFQWRGMAPQASLVDSSDLIDSGNLLSAIVNSSLDVSNHSHILGVDGDYSNKNQIVDQEVRGDATSDGQMVPRRPTIFAAANNGTNNQYGNQIGYFSILNQMKNAIVVGAWDANTNRLANFSSMGPSYDGRIKPDVVAPGVSIFSTGISQNETQRIDFVTNPAGGPVVATPTMGSFQLTFNGQQTNAIPYNASAAVVQNRLSVLTNIAAGDISVTGGPLPGTAIDVVFQGNYANTNVALMTAADTGLDAGMSTRVRTPRERGGMASGNGYRTASGTSMAAPAVTGVVAQLLEGWQTTYADPMGVDIDDNPPLPSTLRALLIQTATDVNNPNVRGAPSVEIDPDSTPGNADDGTGAVTATTGPDYSTGWGQVNAQAASAMLQNALMIEDAPVPKQIIQDAITQNRMKDYDFVVDVASTLKVTLAWDDIASTPLNPATSTMLVNDIDLELIAPDGTVFYPWQLGHTILDSGGNPLADNAQPPGTAIQIQRPLTPVANPTTANEYVPANLITGNGGWVARQGKDHLNNVEQVVVNNAQVGHWKARVIGFDIPSGTQDYSLVGFPYPDLPEIVVSATNKVGLPNIGEPITFTWEAQNIGQLPTGEAGETFNYEILLSRDFALGDDVLLNDTALTPLGPIDAGDAQSQTSTVTITQEVADALMGTTAGTTTIQDLINEDVFLLIRADSDDSVLEHNETNLGFVQLSRLADVILVLDRSGSMSGDVVVSNGTQTKLQILQDSANLFLDLMRLDAGDTLGEVRFSDNGDIIFGPGNVLTALGAGNLAAARTPINNLTADGGTNIRDGLQDALGMFPAGVDNSRRKVIVFFSDGMKTVGDDPTEAAFLQQFDDQDVKVYSVGFGTEGGTGFAGIDIDLLQTLATRGSQGFFQVTESAVGLDKFFVDAVAGAVDAQVVVDPVADLGSGQTDTVPVDMNLQDSIATFILTWDNPAADLRLSLISPTGEEINAANFQLYGDRVARTAAPAYVLYEVQLPLVGGPDVQHAGGWTMKVHNPGESTVRYSASAIAQSTVRAGLLPRDPGSTLHPGASIRLGATLTQDGGNPIQDAVVTVTPNVPVVGLGDLLAAIPTTEDDLLGIPDEINGETLSLQERMYLSVRNRLGGDPLRRAEAPSFQLAMDADIGAYTGTLAATSADGVYSFLIGFEALAADCDPVQRELSQSVAIVPKVDPGLTDATPIDPDPKDDGDLVGIVVTPRDRSGGFFGPGWVRRIAFHPVGYTVVGATIDNGDGSYLQLFQPLTRQPGSISVTFGDTTLPSISIDPGTPAPISVSPSGRRNDVPHEITIGVKTGANISQVNGVTLKGPGGTIALSNVGVHTQTNTITATVPAGLPPGIYQVFLECPIGRGPTSADATFQVIAAGADVPGPLGRLGGVLAGATNAADNATGLTQLGLALRNLRELPVGPNYSSETRQAAIGQVASLLVQGHGMVTPADVTAVQTALESSKVDARFAPAEPVMVDQGVQVLADLDNGVRVTFGNVASGGETTLRTAPGPAEVPTDRRGATHITYDISTTAQFDPNASILVEINYNETDFVDESALRMFHREEGRWVDRTTTLDVESNRIYATVGGFSEFIIVEGLGPIVAPDAGDYNNDGAVDAADFTVWRDMLGQVVTPFTGADGNGNGWVDTADYAVWTESYREFQTLARNGANALAAADPGDDAFVEADPADAHPEHGEQRAPLPTLGDQSPRQQKVRLAFRRALTRAEIGLRRWQCPTAMPDVHDTDVDIARARDVRSLRYSRLRTALVDDALAESEAKRETLPTSLDDEPLAHQLDSVFNEWGRRKIRWRR